ncbi:MAG TPA: hypothetical protein H9881_10755 [Candidatus Stackebrandtia excrementipullorum]|nr:hypothetical protein [Candidatus Stackebrandtia excrementipullorum]
MKSPEWIDLSWSPAPGQKVRSPGTRRAIEVAWWLLLTGPVLLAMMPGSVGGGPWDGVAVGLGVAIALWLRHRVPVAALLVVVTLASWGFIGQEGPGWRLMLLVMMFVLSYLVGRADNSHYPLIVHLGAMSALVLTLVPVLRIGLLNGAGLAALLVFAIVFPWLIGRYRYQRALLFESGWDRARQLEREQRAIADQARLRERARIAEDMHDSLGHELSLIALRSAALEVDPLLPPGQQEAAGDLRRSAAEATERLRQIIGLLRDDNDRIRVEPADESIDDLIARATESGMEIRYLVDGRPEPLPYMVDRAAYRTVQECLTNAAKHATGRPVTVRIGFNKDELLINVSNPVLDGATGIGGGRGLVGLSERLRLAGGQLRSGEEDGEFTVVARLPHHGEPELPEQQEPGSDSLREQVDATRQARRRLVTVFMIPTVLMAVLTVVSMLVYGIVSLYSVLPAATYEQLVVGQSRESVEERLPYFDMIDPPAWIDADPPDDCVYHPSRREFEGIADVYRLCFADGVLVGKDVITAEERIRWFEDRNG